MGKSTKPTKWFKAVKKAFRSPSKERPSPRDKQGDGDEKLLTKRDFPPVSHPAPTPHPLPSFEIVTQCNEVQQHNSTHVPPPPALHQAVGTDPVITNHVDYSKKHKEPVQEEEQLQQQQHTRIHGNIYGLEKHQDDDDDSTLSEEDEAVTRIQQRFRSPLALKGLIRLQALVRGQLVRRQAAITLRTMEAIVRIQALFRGRRVRMSKDGRAVKSRVARIQRISSRAGDHPRRDEFRELESESNDSDLHEANKRKRRTAYLLTQQLKRSTPNRSSSFIDCDPDQPHEGWAWLELWTNAKAWENRQLEAAAECKDSKDYIEIIPGNNSRSSYINCTTDVDVNSLNKMKSYYENANISNINNNSISTSKSSTTTPTTPTTPTPVALDGTSKASEEAEEEADEEEEEEEEEELGPTPEPAAQNSNTKLTSSPKLTTPSPAVSEDAIIPPPSPQASEASVAQDQSGDEGPSMAMEHLVLPEAHDGGEFPSGRTHSDSFSTSNGHLSVHQPAGPGGEDGANAEAPGCEVENGMVRHQENGDGNKTRKEESPMMPSSKRTACRYMAATESAKAKFRSSSNPKSRGSTPEFTPDSPGQPTPPKHRTSHVGGSHVGSKAVDSPHVGSNKAVESPAKTPVAFGTRKTTTTVNAVQSRRSPSPKTTGGPREKPRSVDATGHGGVSPARRNSLGTGDDKRWRT